MRSEQDWFENEELFLEQLADGHRWAEQAAVQLRSAGVAVTVTPMEVRAHVDDRGEFADEWDMTVGTRAPCRIDVKSRNLEFTRPDDYPYPTALVDTVSGWDAKDHRPAAIILVSQKTCAALVIPVSTEPRWSRQWRFDRIRNIRDCFYELDRRELCSLPNLVRWLQHRENGRNGA